MWMAIIQHHFKSLLFPYLIILVISWKLTNHICGGSISWLSFLFHYVYLMPKPHCVEYCSLTLSLKICFVHPPTLFYFFQITLAIQTFYFISISILYLACQFPQKNLWKFWVEVHWIYRSLVILYRSDTVLTLSLPTHSMLYFSIYLKLF